MWLATLALAMEKHASIRSQGEGGFSLVEVLIGVTIIVVMAAVALPNIGGYLRNYRVRGGARDVSSEMQASRSKAIMSNTNNGVFFVIVDADSYRWVMADNPAAKSWARCTTCRTGWSSCASTEANSSEMIRFNRLGGFCNPEANPSTCAPTIIALCTAQETSRCNLAPGTRTSSRTRLRRGHDRPTARGEHEPRAHDPHRPRRSDPPPALKIGPFPVPGPGVTY